MSTFQVVLFLLVVVSSVYCRPTHCDRWRGDNQFRCAKDDYRADSVRVRNISGSNVSFKVGKWLSTCNHAGTNYSDRLYSFGSGGSVDVDFGEVGPGACNEMFIYNCKIDGRGVNCLDAVSPSPN